MLLESLDSRDVFEQYIIAGGPHTPVEILVALAKNAAHKVRMRVAENPHTPAEILEKLAYDSHPDVRIAVGSNTSVPNHVLIALLNDADPTVRFSLAEDANTPAHILESLAEDDNPYVVQRVRKTLSILSSNVVDASVFERVITLVCDGPDPADTDVQFA